MIVDIGRDPFTQPVQFFVDGGPLMLVQWYPAPQGAQWLPTGTIFGNPIWTQPSEGWTGAGASYLGGYAVNWIDTPPTVDGQSYVGPLSSFANGLPTDPNQQPTYYDSYGIPAQIGQRVGGAVGGGDAIFHQVPVGGGAAGGNPYAFAARVFVASGGAMGDGSAGDVTPVFEASGGAMGDGSAGDVTPVFEASGGAMGDGSADDLDGYFVAGGGGVGGGS